MFFIILFSILVLYVFICAFIYGTMRNIYVYGDMTSLAAPRRRWIYYLLSFTWGLPMNIIGCIVALVLLCCGKKPEKYGWNYMFRLPVNFGLELGIFFIAPLNATAHTKNHEVGHSIQNAYFGPFTIGVVSIPSAVRYWWRRIKQKMGKKITTKYDDIWFEGQATQTGFKFIEEINKREE